MSTFVQGPSAIQRPLSNEVRNFGSYDPKLANAEAIERPTQEYNGYQQAYDYFNEHLFAEALPNCLITFQRTPHARGYYASDRFVTRSSDEGRTGEIALNPDTFKGRNDKEILSTLVHECCHLYQAHYGKPGRRGYHNREWARLMLSVGLCPVSFDQLGKMTGRAVSHEILPGGRFDIAAAQLLTTGFCLHWQSATTRESDIDHGGSPIMQQGVSKVKYTCRQCGARAWAKPTSQLVCAPCVQKHLEQCEHWMYPDEVLTVVTGFGMRPCL